MAVKRIEHTATFTAADDAGHLYTLYVYTEFLDVETTGAPGATLEGGRSIRDEDGIGVGRVRKGEYLTLSGKTLRSDDPNAP